MRADIVTLLVVGGISLVLFVGARAFVSSTSPTQTQAAPVVIAEQPAAPGQGPAISVETLVQSPSEHLGHVVVTGVVATATAGRFLLIDAGEFRQCGMTCVNEAGTAKVPVRWSGAPPPAVAQTVRVEGELVKTPKGFVFTARTVSK